MTDSEKILLEKLQNLDDFESAFEDHAEIRPKHGVVGLGRGGNQPAFKAQIDVIITALYATVATGVQVLPAALPAIDQTGLPVYIFGNTDFQGAYASSAKNSPSASNWSRLNILRKGYDSILSTTAYTLANANSKIGDLIITYVNASTLIYGFVIITCAQVSYLTLLASLASDTFVINQIRYTVADATKLGQFNQNINILKQSLFGKTENDFVSPVAFRNPQNQQPNILDIPVSVGLDKNKILTTYINYDTVTFTWSLFVATISKIKSI